MTGLKIVMVQSGEAQDCTTQQNNLNVCSQFVVLGSNSQPNTDCCSALRFIDHDCFYNTLRITFSFPIDALNLRDIQNDGSLSQRATKENINIDCSK
ncbi:hypothetical protein UlMin_006569 [Ulmus minor]